MKTRAKKKNSLEYGAKVRNDIVALMRAALPSHERAHRLYGDLRLRFAYVLAMKQKLAIEIRHIDRVEIDLRTGTGDHFALQIIITYHINTMKAAHDKILQQLTADTASAHHQNACIGRCAPPRAARRRLMHYGCHQSIVSFSKSSPSQSTRRKFQNDKNDAVTLGEFLSMRFERRTVTRADCINFCCVKESAERDAISDDLSRNTATADQTQHDRRITVTAHAHARPRLLMLAF